MNRTKSLDKRMEDAAGRTENISLSQATGRSQEELSQMSEEELGKLAMNTIKKLRDTAVNDKKTIVLTYNLNGEQQEIRIVPSELDTAKHNAVKDGDEKANIYQNGKQTSMTDLAKKGTVTLAKALKNRVETEKQNMDHGIERSVSEFGR